MATIVFGDNPGPVKFTDPDVDFSVEVLLRDGEGATAHFVYTDLDALSETVILFTDARDALVSKLIRECSVDVPANKIMQGEQITVGGRIRVVTMVTINADGVCLHTRDPFDGSSHPYLCDTLDPVRRISPPVQAA